MTGLATVVTATVTIVTTLDSHDTPSSPVSGAASTSSQTAAPVAATVATSAAPTASGPSPRIQWGPGNLVITNDGADFSSVPPVSDAHSGDLYSAGASLSSLWDTRLAVWTGAAAPPAQQCGEFISTQAAGGLITVNPGTVVCAETTDNVMAIMKVTSVNGNDGSIATQTTVWDMPAS